MPLFVACLSVDDASRLIGRWATSADYRYVAKRQASTAARSLAGRAALRALLAEVTGQPDWEIRPDAAGKPFIRAEAPAPAISLSHSGERVAVAIDAPGMALGIDIERHASRDFLGIARHWFGPEEIEAVAIHGGDAFYRIWTAREALAKARGTGLSGALGAGDMVGAGVDRGSWVRNGFGFRHCRVFPEYSLMVATEGTAPPIAAFVTL